jgi:microcompartment protein CcmK/EutM
MRYARVIGTVVSTVKHPAFRGRTLLVVQPLDEHGADAGPSFLAIDRAQAGVGDRVIVMSEGGGVRQMLAAERQGDQVPIRSAVVGIVDALDAGEDRR